MDKAEYVFELIKEAANGGDEAKRKAQEAGMQTVHIGRDTMLQRDANDRRRENRERQRKGKESLSVPEWKQREKERSQSMKQMADKQRRDAASNNAMASN